jgi:diguanylate cyclase (GGDEF)-like protein
VFGRTAAAVGGWALWRLPRGATGYVVAVIASPAVVLAVMVWTGVDRYRLSDLGTVLLLSCCALVSIEGARRVGMPTLVAGRPYRDLVSVWLFAIALLLPAPYVVLGAAVLFPLLVRGVLAQPWRRTFNAAGFALAGLAAHWVAVEVGRGWPRAAVAVGGTRPVVALLLAAVVYELVNVVLVTLAIRLVEPQTPLRLALGDAGTLVTDITALTLGLLAAVAWSVSPALVLATVPPVVLLQRALIHDELREAAQTDAKTGLATAAYWMALAQRSLDRGGRESSHCGVLLLDIDHFKEVNDTWGHLVGDEVLAEVARTLRGGVRPADVVGRLGGEEFAVLLPDTGVVEAAAVAERVRAQMAAHTVPVVGAGGQQGLARITVSVGVANTGDVGFVISDLLASADAALYRAKAGGRDRVEVGGPIDATERLWLSHVPAGLFGRAPSLPGPRLRPRAVPRPGATSRP